jgi:outer membrane autotransporter protein
VLQQLVPTGPAYTRLKAYAESRAASLAFANQGLDFILNRGFGSALAATSGPGFRFGGFGGLGGGWSRYDTGSHVDVSGMSLLAGLALGSDISHGRLTLGAFFEGGWGNYNSRNSFSNAASVHGKGDTSYYGGGILGRYDLTQGALSGLYFDASARVGRAKTDVRSGDIQYNGWRANFDSSSLYYGLHGGLGYVWKLTDKAFLDLSAKLLWTRQRSDNVTVWQDRVRFKDADSLRSRLGGRFTHSVNEYVSPYLGAYWEHEFDGKQRTSVNGNRLSSPSLEGDTGIFEAGLTWKPSRSLPLSFDLGVQGYTGKREGVTGSLQVKFEF